MTENGMIYIGYLRNGVRIHSWFIQKKTKKYVYVFFNTVTS